MSTYNPQGKPHLFLERLADGELSFVALAEQMNGGTVAAKKRKTFHTLSAMLKDGLIAGSRASYVITQAGSDALQGLRAGKPVAIVATSSVRVFD